MEKKTRATDFKNTNRLYQVMEDLSNQVLYYLQSEPDKAFVCDKLMHISEDAQVPPEWVSKWKWV